MQMRLNWYWVLGFAAFVVVLTPTDASAWGPATHVKLASDLLDQLHLLPPALALLLARYRKDYLFGNIAADVVMAKRLSRIKQMCHHWATGFAMFDDAPDDRGRAFALGYLSHLAADTVAHNKFLPRQMTLTRTTMTFGHLYWELRADSTIGPYYWAQLRTALKEVYAQHEAVLSSRLTDTFLPFPVNWRLFYRMNRFVSRRLWLKAMQHMVAASRWNLSDHLMREYRAECLARMIDLVTHLQQSTLLHEDPNGNAALAYTKMQRRQLRQMARAGLITPHMLYEAEQVHSPKATLIQAGHPKHKN